MKNTFRDHYQNRVRLRHYLPLRPGSLRVIVNYKNAPLSDHG